jgi:hypothetical protein
VAAFVGHEQSPNQALRISTFREILEKFAGRISLEIELKGPEPEAIFIIGAVLQDYRPFWDTMEIASSEPLLLAGILGECPGIATD